jgi:parallel beta-helix repeat protein/predicted outer membrane repeat protein
MKLFGVTVILATILIMSGITPPTRVYAQTIINVPADYTTIQAGINAAVAGDTVQVAAGTFYEHISLKDGVAVIGAGASVTAIDGGGSGTVVTATNAGSGTRLEGFTVTNGSPTSYDGNPGIGGGMFNDHSSPTVTNCAFSANTAGWGGGMFNDYSTPIVTDCIFSNNSGNSGSAMFNNAGGGMFNNHSSPMVIDCIFSNNSADFGGGICNSDSSPMVISCSFSSNSADLSGGGICNDNESLPTVNGCTFNNNSAYYGGGMYNRDYSSPTVINCSFSNNTNNYGGGMYNCEDSSPTVTDCTFSGNTVNSDGGGMYNYDNSSPIVTDCIFSTNSADHGGGIYNKLYSLPMITGCTFSGNAATVDGGGMYSYDHSSPTVADCAFIDNSAVNSGAGMFNNQISPIITNCSFISNSADYSGGGIHTEYSITVVTNCVFFNNFGGYGGGMYNYFTGSMTITNCTFFNNSANEYGNGINNEHYSTTTLTNCILWNQGWSEVADWESTTTVSYSNIHQDSGVYPGTGNINSAPLFVDSIAGDLHLQVGSPCIDTGTNTNAPSDDIEGNLRTVDGDLNGTEITDMGAYEFIPPNNPPELNFIGDKTINELDTLSFTISASDPDSAQALTYSISSGKVDGMNLIQNTGVFSWMPSVDQEPDSYELTFRVTDDGTPPLYDEETITITVNEPGENHPPTNINLSNSNVEEGQPFGIIIGEFSTFDPDAGDSHSYTLVDEENYPDNSAFCIMGPLLQGWTIFDFEAQNSYSIKVCSTDSGGLWFEKEFTITIIPENIPGDTASLLGSVNIDLAEIISITLSDADVEGIHFGSVSVPSHENSELGQSDTIPAVRVNIAPETNVALDIGVKGNTGMDDLLVGNWKYSLTYAGDLYSLTGDYALCYANQTVGSILCNFWHWLDIPDGTIGGDHACTITYKAVKTGTSFE